MLQCNNVTFYQVTFYNRLPIPWPLAILLNDITFSSSALISLDEVRKQLNKFDEIWKDIHRNISF
jgi:hypothetical protein